VAKTQSSSKFRVGHRLLEAPFSTNYYHRLNKTNKTTIPHKRTNTVQCQRLTPKEKLQQSKAATPHKKAKYTQRQRLNPKVKLHRRIQTNTLSEPGKDTAPSDK